MPLVTAAVLLLILLGKVQRKRLAILGLTIGPFAFLASECIQAELGLSDGTISFLGAFDRDRPQQRRGMAWRFRTTAAKTSL